MTLKNESTRYAEVLVDLDTESLDRRTFTYIIPPEFENILEIGMPVSVPFGRMNLITGYVVGFTGYVASGVRLKQIADILDEEPLFDLQYLQFLDWLATYYATPLITVLSAALPSSMVQRKHREVVLEPSSSYVSDKITGLPLQAHKIISFLQDRPSGKGVRVRYLASQIGIPLKLVNQTLYRLRSEGIVRLQSQDSHTIGTKHIKWVRFAQPFQTGSLTKREAEILDCLNLHAQSEITLSDAISLAKTTTSTLKKLVAHGAIEIFEAPSYRDRQVVSYYEKYHNQEELILNDEQNNAVERVLTAEHGSNHLLYGITGSGKTEVYMALTHQMLKKGKSVLVLVPEISLTSHIARRFIERFGTNDVVLWHSKLSAGEKIDAWRRIHRGELKIVIGARSAIFTPLKNLGLIVMDEEHEGSFKQEHPAPRYHAGKVASELVKLTGAKLIKGSATPDIESFREASQKQSLLLLTRRYGGRSLAKVEVVDMRDVRRHGNVGTISPKLQIALQETIERKEQAVILLNRRGFYTLITCNECEEIFCCSNCTVALTYHRAQDKVRCHYCGHEENKPQFCPHCASFDISFAGFGTQRLEEELEELFPDVRIMRLDSDVMQKKFAYRDIFEAFAAHEADILVGTQMVAKGLDVPNVTLVGVVAADVAFSLPDYRSSERAFQLLTQVAGRSGRGDKKGRVIIQTRQPAHPVILRAKEQDYEGFYEDELARRQEFDFPPYSQLFRMIASGSDEFRVRNFMKAIALNMEQLMKETVLQDKAMLLGPAPCVISRIQGKYRYHLIVKSQGGEDVHKFLTRFYRKVEAPEHINFILDIDTQSFL